MVANLTCQSLLGNDFLFGYNSVINFKEVSVKLREAVLNIEGPCLGAETKWNHANAVHTENRVSTVKNIIL